MMVTGLGNEFRHDDAVGLIAARWLRKQGVAAEEHHGDPAALLDRWYGREGLILIDAISSGAVPGMLHRLDASVSPLPRELLKTSTHAVGLADAVELSHVLGTLPARVLVFGVDAGDLTAGVGLSAEVERALPGLVEAVVSYTKSCL
jgi:hydrogenase maturation protease